MAKKIIKKDEYMIRSLSYYQLKGGIYNEIITVLMQLRDNNARERVMTPARIMNEASFVYDQCKDAKSGYGRFKELWGSYTNLYTPKECQLIFSVFYILVAEDEPINIGIIVELGELLKKDAKLFAPFERLFQLQEAEKDDTEQKIQRACEDRTADFKNRIQELESQNERLTDALADKENELADVRKELKEKDSIIRFMEEDKVEDDEPTLDDVFTFDNTLQYIQTRQHYSFCSQIFGMVKDLMMSNRKLVTDEQFNQLSAVEQQMLMRQDDQHVVNINYNYGGLVLQGLIESEEFKELMKSPSLPIAKEPKEIAMDMIKLYLEHGRSEEK